MIDVVTFGETMALVRTDLPGRVEYGTRCTIGLGGADSNVAIGLSRLGHRVRWISALGKDDLGNMIYQKILEQGVDVAASFSTNRPTGLMLKSPSGSSERFVSFYRSGSAASALGPEHVTSDLLAGAKILHVTGITPALSDSCAELAHSAIRLAKQMGVLVSFDVNYRSALWHHILASSVYREMVGYADIVFGDLTELSMLSDEHQNQADLLRNIAALGPKTVVLKQGALGATAFSEGEFVNQVAIEVEVADTVGAGDGFVAGYLSATLDGADIQERLFRAAFCGAQVCRDPGDWEGAPVRQELELARQELVR